MTLWKKLLFGIVPLFFIIISFVIWHLVLLNQDDGVILKLGPLPSIKLGIDRINIFTPELEKSYTIVKAEGDPLSEDVRIRIPKFEQNIYIDYEDTGKIYGRMVGTNEQRIYTWKSDTGYICGTPDMMAANVEGKDIDPQKEFANYKFFVFGDGFRGIQGDIGLDGFRQDLVKGNGAKAYLSSDVPNADGTYDLVGLILFTTKDQCVLVDEMPPEPEQQ